MRAEPSLALINLIFYSFIKPKSYTYTKYGYIVCKNIFKEMKLSDDIPLIKVNRITPESITGKALTYSRGSLNKISCLRYKLTDNFSAFQE